MEVQHHTLGVGYGLDNSYGFLTQTAQGLKPMPGITQISVTSKNNGSLKQVSKKLGLSIRLSSHIGRHTFTRIGLQKNVSLYSLSKLLNHKSIKTTQVYLKNFDEEIIYKELDDKVYSEFNY